VTLGAFGIALLIFLPYALHDPWARVAVQDAILLGLGLWFVPLPWARLWRPSLRGVVWGAGAAIVMYVGGWIVMRLIAGISPETAASAADVLAWAGLVSLPVALTLLTLTVVVEEVFWRGVLGLALADRTGPWIAVAIGGGGFALAHVTAGPPILAIAALSAGTAWSWLAIRTRSLFAAFVCHLAWDILVVFVAPY
jgi:membrane protease YdiL (CAAX protease family)